MDYLFVLSQEHAVLAHLAALLEDTLRAGDRSAAQQVIRRMRVLLRDMHAPKETVVTSRVDRTRDENLRALLEFLAAEEEALEALEHASAHAPPVDAELNAAVHAVRDLLCHEDEVARLVVAHETDDGLWNMAVELDRWVDRLGRRRWERWVATTAQRLQLLPEYA